MEMKNTLRALTIALGLAVAALCGCADDKGNYDYRSLCEPDITGVADSLSVLVHSRLTLQPDLGSSIARPDDYGYEWRAIASTLQPGKAVTGTAFDHWPEGCECRYMENTHYDPGNGTKGTEDLRNVFYAYVCDPRLVSDFEEACEKWNLAAKGKPSPDFHAVDADGNSYSLANFRGKYVFIDLWATWCGPCQREMPYLKKLQASYEGKNIVFVSLSIDSDKAKWERWAKGEGTTGVQLHIGQGSKFQRDYGIGGIPHFILIGPDGSKRIIGCPSTNMYGDPISLDWTYNADGTLASITYEDEKDPMLVNTFVADNMTATTWGGEYLFGHSTDLAVPETINPGFLLNFVTYIVFGNESISLGMLLNQNVKTSKYIPNLVKVWGYDENGSDTWDEIAIRESFADNVLTLDTRNAATASGFYGSLVTAVYKNK